jgi:N-acetylneuraminic acid mutarotase
MFGGYALDVMGDTWTWDGAKWTWHDTDGPPARSGAAMATLDGTAVLFGGSDTNGNALGDTWTWDGLKWMSRSVAGPSARAGAAMTTVNGTVLLFGGADSAGNARSDTWTWDGGSWAEPVGETSPLFASPRPRSRPRRVPFGAPQLRRRVPE